MKYIKLIIYSIILFTVLPGTVKAQLGAISFSKESKKLLLNHEATIFPNPVTDNKFKIKSADIIFSVDVINVIGQSILKKMNSTLSRDDIEIHLGDCEKGMYLVKITFNDEKSIIKKLLVK